MYFPTEIQALIIREAIETVPFQDLVRARQVNSFWTSEIDSLLHLSPHLETEGFLFKPGKESDPCVKSPTWERSPAKLKRRYLQRRVEQKKERPCRFTLTLDALLELLEGEELPMTLEEYTIMRDRFIDVWPFGEKCCAWHALGPAADSNKRYCRAGSKDLHAALACSAALRGDYDTFQELLDRIPRRENFWGPPQYEFDGTCHIYFFAHASDFGQLRVYDVASQVGTAELMKIVISNEYYMNRGHRISYRKRFPTLLAKAGNWSALQTLVRHFRQYPQPIGWGEKYGSLAWRSRTTIHGAVVGAQFDLLELLRHELEDEVDMIEFDFEVLMQAVRYGDTNFVQYALNRPNIDINARHINTYDYTPLFRAFLETPKPLKLPIIKILLENGADVHEGRAKTGKTLMEFAVARGDDDIAKAIIEHEKKLPGSHSTFPYITRKRDMVQAAVRYKSPTLIEALRDYYEHPFYSRGGKRFTVRKNGLGMGDSEKILEEIPGQGDVKYIVTVSQNNI